MLLSQIANIKPGYPFRGSIAETEGSDIVAVQMKDVSPHEGITWASCTPTLLEGKRKPDWLTPGDILVAARGSKNYAVLVKDDITQKSIQAVAAPHFYIVTAQHPDVLPEYLAWLLNQSPCQRYFEQNAEGSVSKSIRRSVLEQTPIAIPSLAKQQAIVGLAQTIREEQLIAEQLIRNGERMMNCVATDLLND